VDVVAHNAEDHRRWFGWIESRMRMLILALEQPPALQAHPYANALPNPQYAEGQHVTSFFIGLSFPSAPVSATSMDLGPIVQDFVYMANQWDRRKRTMELVLLHHK
jgi:poly(A) polymerase